MTVVSPFMTTHGVMIAACFALLQLVNTKALVRQEYVIGSEGTMSLTAKQDTNHRGSRMSMNIDASGSNTQGDNGVEASAPERGFHTSDGSEIPRVKTWGPGPKPATSMLAEGEKAADGSFYGMEMVEKVIREDSDLVNTMLEQQKEAPAWQVYAKQKPRHPQAGIPVTDPGSLFGVKSTIKEEQSAGYAVCDSGGDPHITAFDRGPAWHPMHAPGNWWVVHTADNSIQVQAQYSGAGAEGRGSWMGAKITVNGRRVPRTANSALAISGNFLKSKSGKQNTLILKPPCEWYRDNNACGKDPQDGSNTAGNTQFRMYWNGAKVKSLNSQDPKISVKPGGTYVITAGASDELRIHASPWGKGSFSPQHSMFNLRVEMKKPGCKVCGHCGNWNGQGEEQRIYRQWGEYGGSADADLCKADVPCAERLIKGKDFGSFDPGTSKGCPEPAGAGFTLEECKKTSAYDPARAACIASLKGVAFFDQANRFKALEVCMLDECVNKGFNKDNIKEAVVEDQEEKIGFKAIEDVGEFDNACEVGKTATVVCDCRGDIPAEAPLICQVGETCDKTWNDAIGQMGAQCKSR